MRHLWIWVGLVACNTNEEDATLRAYRTAVGDTRTMVSAHRDAVEAAESLAVIDGLESAYLAQWNDAELAIQQPMGDMEGCSMLDGNGSMRDAMTSTMAHMDDSVSTHVHDHDAHQAVNECHDAELHQEDEMLTFLDDMSAQGNNWESGIGCAP